MSDEKWVDIWVPVISGAGYVEPDLPHKDLGGGEFEWLVHFQIMPNGAPRDLTIQTANKPASGHFHVQVRAEDVEKCTKRVAEVDVPEKDRLVIDMIRRCARKWDTEADTFFDEIPNVATGNLERRQMVKGILIQAVSRGLSADKAETIRVRLNLPLAAVPRRL